MNIAADLSLCGLGQACVPAGQRFIIVGTGVDHAVAAVVLGPVIIGISNVGGVHSELQDLHVGIAAVLHQLADALGHEAEILRNDGHIAQAGVDGVEQVHAGTLLPVAVLGTALVGRDGEVLVKATEMVDADHIIQLEGMPHTGDPPLIAGGLVEIPAVQGIAPDLAVLGKGIGGAACDGGGLIVLIQLEQLGMGPDIGTVGRNVDGDIAHDLDVLVVGILFKPCPLLVKLELDVFLELYVKIQLPVVIVQGKAPVHPDILGPLPEGHFLEEGFQGHEQGIVIEPPVVVIAEGPELRIMADVAALIRLMQQGKAVFMELVEVHLGSVVAKVHSIAFFLSQNTFRNEGIQGDQIGIAGKSGIGLVWGIVRAAVGGRTQRQDLPIALTGCGQPVHKIISRLVKAADTVVGRQAGNRQQDTCVTLHN